MRIISGLALGAALAIASVPAYGAENVTVRANSGLTEIYQFGRTYGGTCNSAPPPRFKIRKQAENGRIVARVVRKTFADDHKRCAGKSIQVFVVDYQPDRGFHGRDTATVTLRYDAYSNVNYQVNRSVRFNINVE